MTSLFPSVIIATDMRLVWYAMHVCACVAQLENDNEHLYWHLEKCFLKKQTGKYYSVPADVERNARHQQNILVSVPHVSALALQMLSVDCSNFEKYSLTLLDQATFKDLKHKIGTVGLCHLCARSSKQM